MANEQIPVTGKVISWARDRAGMSIAEAQQSFPQIEQWEAEESFPTYPQLERLSVKFKLPVAAFFFPEPPKLPPIKESFRTLPDTEFELMPTQVRFLLQKAKAFQLNLKELSGGGNPAPRQITRDLAFPDDISATEMAVIVREYLNVPIETQFTWPDDEAALKAWRKVLQDVGIFVFKDAFRAEGYFGFSLYDDTFPLIFVNNTATKTRQCFTLFHELAHIVFRTSGIDEAADDRFIGDLAEHQRRIEVLCNRFAAEFLVPDAVFAALMKDRQPSEATAETLAARFHVSRETIFRKFLDRHWIKQEHYEAAAEKWRKQMKGGSGGDYYRTKIAYLGREYIELALREYHQNRISENQLADYLDVKPKNVGTLEEYFAGGQ
jgi:Zn-dependent peptidase ImmA (M78 family)